MQEKYNKYRLKMEDFAEITAVFDPRCKLVIIELMLLKEISSEAAEESLSRIKKDLLNFYSKFVHTLPAEPAKNNNNTLKNQNKTVETNDNDFNDFLASKHANDKITGTKLAFLTSGRVLGDFRSQMVANTLKALVCGQDWFCSKEDVNNNKDDEEEESDDDIELGKMLGRLNPNPTFIY
ncbi:hypothetical protein PGT21_021433 [Puccinia graminis f. sp. tritici]|uniref:hAT-like transposase RNase-H fold domain-containing protein n=1 Tax=Puccinia graminis f. sp. tritici TaxID=56615 RepID=A0A5B0MA18_PUCGR|nr:hypothetical protein PGT21_021433 [Puccinia graminis f. sp. tritici]